MLGDSVHHIVPGQQVTAGDEDEEEQLRASQDLPANVTQANGGQENLAGIGHAVNMGVSQFELADHIPGIRREDAQADDQDNRTISITPISQGRVYPMMGTHGTIPSAATVDGRERIPREMVSAIITRWVPR